MQKYERKMFLRWLFGFFKYLLGIKYEKKPKLKLCYLKHSATSICDASRYVQMDYICIDNEDDIENELPILYVNDEAITQSNAILRYVCNTVNLYPNKNLKDAANVDECCEMHSTFLNILNLNLNPTKYGLTKNVYDVAIHRQWIIREHVPKYLKYVDKDLQQTGWLAKMHKLSMADLCWHPTLCWLRDGHFDGVDSHTFSNFPMLVAWMVDVSEFHERNSSVQL